MPETFTTTVSAFGNFLDLTATGDDGNKLDAIPIKLTFNGRPGMSEFITSPAFSEGGTLIEANQYSIVRFRSIRQEQRRDWYLILIGAFVGFGAALMVEAFRPLIERIGEAAVPPRETL